MSIKILIVEDEILIAEDMSADLEDLGYIVVGIALSGDECIESVERYSPDIVLMDVKIKGSIDGIEIAHILKRKKNIPIIFITSNTDSQTMKRAIESKPQAFLSKPYNRKELGIAIELAINNHNEGEFSKKNNDEPTLNSSIFVKNGELYSRIELDSIFYIEAAGSYCTVNAEKGDFILSNNLSHFKNKVNNPNFIRIHRSFIVNIQKVDGFDTNHVIVNGKELPISKSFRTEVIQLFKKV